MHTLCLSVYTVLCISLTAVERKYKKVMSLGHLEVVARHRAVT